MFDTHVDLTPLMMILMTSGVIPLVQFGAHTLVALILKKLEPTIGPQRALAVQAQADKMFEHAIGEASLHYLPELQAHGLSVDVGNVIAARAVGYFLANGPELAAKVQAYEGNLEEMAKARLLAHPAVAASGALGIAQPLRAAA